MILPLTYNWRSLFVRRASTLLTLAVVAVVVFVLAVLLSYAAGIHASLAASGTPQNLIVLKPGATSESTSIVVPEEANRVMQAPGIGRAADGALLVSPEISVQTNLPRIGAEGRNANVAVRGVDDVAFQVHTEVSCVQGRWFRQGALEAVVGRAARQRYAGLELGQRVALGRSGDRFFEIVGEFEADAGALESEIWIPRTILCDVYDRRLSSSIVVRLEDPAAAAAAIEYINGPAVRLNAKRETDYYGDLSRQTRQIVELTTALVALMGIGAAFAVANTMYAAVDGRRREIAMLRTIGFPRRAIVLSFVLESLLLCIVACALGLAASLYFNGRRQDYLSDMTYTVLAYEQRVTPQVLGAALGVACAVAVVGALAPALRAGRIRIIEALRAA